MKRARRKTLIWNHKRFWENSRWLRLGLESATLRLSDLPLWERIIDTYVGSPQAHPPPVPAEFADLETIDWVLSVAPIRIGV